MIRLPLFLCFSLIACNPGDTSPKDDTSDPSNTDTSDTDTDTDTDDTGDTDTDTDTDDTDDTGDTGVQEDLEIIGDYDDGWGGTHQITSEGWLSGSATYTIRQYENLERYVVAQNGADNTWNPTLWSRFEWAWDADGALYYCQGVYNAATEADALAAPPANDSDLVAGCGGFSWTEIRPMLSIGGAWSDGWGGSHSINAFAWTSGSSRFDVTVADDEARWLVAQNAATNTWSPGLWSRFDWTWDTEGGLWYCQTAYAAATEADALATPAADPADPASTGCGPFSWTSMVAQ